MDKKKLKVCFAASSGGHFEQLMMLRPLMEEYDSFILTEKTIYDIDTDNIKTHHVIQINRKEKLFPLKFIICFVESFVIFIKEKPDIIISTGVLACVPMCLIIKAFGKKLIYIESFAKVSTPTVSGKFLYKHADQFYVQWESMKGVYPEAIYRGGIY